jgi:PHD/YefM family antitoxin component YafN of YafNO toxin-antitoxin module
MKQATTFDCLRYVTDAAGKKTAVIVPVKDYERLMVGMDELECIKANDHAKARKQAFVPAEDVFAAIESKG